MGGYNIGFKGKGKWLERSGIKDEGWGHKDGAKARVNMAHKNNGYQDEDGGTRTGRRQGLTWRMRIRGTRMRMGAPGRGKPRPYIYFLTRFHKWSHSSRLYGGHQDGASPIPTFIL